MKTDNPNKYDDDDYTEAANQFQADVTNAIDRLWAAGASANDIENEWNNAVENSEAA